MSSPSGLAQPRFDLRWLFGSPLLTAACVAGLCASVVLARALDTLLEARQLRVELELRAVALAAEAAASRFVSSDVQEQQTVDVGRGIRVKTDVDYVPPNKARVTAGLLDGRPEDNLSLIHI